MRIKRSVILESQKNVHSKFSSSIAHKTCSYITHNKYTSCPE